MMGDEREGLRRMPAEDRMVIAEARVGQLTQELQEARTDRDTWLREAIENGKASILAGRRVTELEARLEGIDSATA